MVCGILLTFFARGPLVLLSEIEIKHCQVLVVHNVSRIRLGKTRKVMTQANKIENQPAARKRGSSSELHLKQNQTSDQKTPFHASPHPSLASTLCGRRCDAMHTRWLDAWIMCPQPRRWCMMGKRLRGSSGCDSGHVAT
jgi:hypothetical protein